MAGTGTAHLRDDDVLLRVEELVVEFPAGKGRRVHAVSGISFDVLEGETLGLVGESGCGKSTTGRAVIQLPAPTSGTVTLGDVEVSGLKGEALRQVRSELQMIFQDPISSLNPRRKVRESVAEGLRIWGRSREEVDAKVAEVFDAVGMNVELVGDRRPNEFSGGQCQRISIARALAMDPKILICDEPVSALDVSVQAQVINLLEDMKRRYGLTMIFIAHDLGVVKSISDRVMVMYLGKVCEVAPSDELFADPQHHYSRLLIESIPSHDPDARLEPATGAVEMPSPIDPPSGCRFRTRCPAAQDLCSSTEPELREVRPGHFVACHFPEVGGR
ncbi:ATP-binding cassette domain-containing protein [Nocardioides sp. zg-579]|uniref:ATP-binding cassette domain-containing protein n=1 Tax=Nocardioides marmotae TaxID=2663857 RepID=A0A6I3IYJ5_9ACTN|nr:oligopeptide/dipeptide ABC transporter ATP-binding protein [Nocardioides marmotae]MCR6030110.1 ATP-binding cassette domain-containing protein [Gordonia jinghuaiqii]MTB93741.1 ATP-binding cassette domain-containing protein [Nocardioides marmotae]QKE00082.1 ATP-binding cassette domain-containing protein [Nocardioides marmotae]